MLLAMLAQASFAQNDLQIDGTCPDLVLSGSQFRPGTALVVIRGSGPGATRLADGPCRGLETDLADIVKVGVFRAPQSGEFSKLMTVPEPACEAIYQIVDLRTCTISNPAWLPVDDLPDEPTL